MCLYHVYVYIYIYIYICSSEVQERHELPVLALLGALHAGDQPAQGLHDDILLMCIYVYIIILIHIHVYRERERDR